MFGRKTGNTLGLMRENTVLNSEMTTIPNKIRLHPYDCEIGELIKAEESDHGPLMKMTFIVGNKHCERLFQRVTMKNWDNSDKQLDLWKRVT